MVGPGESPRPRHGRGQTRKSSSWAAEHAEKRGQFFWIGRGGRGQRGENFCSVPERDRHYGDAIGLAEAGRVFWVAVGRRDVAGARIRAADARSTTADGPMSAATDLSSACPRLQALRDRIRVLRLIRSPILLVLIHVVRACGLLDCLSAWSA